MTSLWFTTLSVFLSSAIAGEGVPEHRFRRRARWRHVPLSFRPRRLQRCRTGSTSRRKP